MNRYSGHFGLTWWKRAFLSSRALGTVFVLLLMCVASPGVQTAAGQTALLKGAMADKGEANLPGSVESLVEQARKDGLAVVVISPRDEPVAAGPDMSTRMTQMGLQARQRMKAVLMAAPAFLDNVAEALARSGADGSRGWLPWSVLTAIAGILAGFLPARAISYWGRETFRYMYDPEPRDEAEKIGYLLFRASSALVNTLLLFAVAAVIAIIFDFGHEAGRATVFTIIATYTAWRIASYVVLANLVAPDIPSHRLIHLSDADAGQVYRDWRWTLAISIAMFGAASWLQAIGVARTSQVLCLIVTSLIAAALFGAMILRHRRIFGGAILGAGNPQDKPAWRRFLASSWHLWGLLYLAAAWAVSSFRLVLDIPSKALLIVAPPAALIGGLAVYGVLVLLIERFYRARRAAFDRRMRNLARAEAEQRRIEADARREAEQAGLVEGEEREENLAGDVPAARELPQYRPVFKPLMQHTAAIVVTIVALGFVLGAWDVRAGERGNPVTAFMDTLSFIVAAWVLYRAVDVYVAAKLADEGGPGEAAQIADEEPGGHGATRLGTLLPIIRVAAKTTILVIVGMIVLSNLGVDIAPLFAGAGVVGLAVGFGAQTLIRDIFSGGFFLFDDAFRKGEYIELGDIRGTVEKISLRSFQLRHHNGPLHTIPFGEIKQLTNYSRDWVIMKLPLRLTFDTDIEKVRKLVKKLGQELLDNPEVGRNFLQPLKSQGVVQMDDSAMILRVKFMTRPGDQWVTRKVVYTAIQELFRREGIHLANREVTVRIADGPNRPLTEEEKESAAAAAARTLDDQAANRPAPSGDDR